MGLDMSWAGKVREEHTTPRDRDSLLQSRLIVRRTNVNHERLIARCGVGVVGTQPPKLQGPDLMLLAAGRLHTDVMTWRYDWKSPIFPITTSTYPVIIILMSKSNSQSCRMISQQTAPASKNSSLP
jgi:hypothetical protein